MGQLLNISGVIWETVKTKLRADGQAKVHVSSVSARWSRQEERLKNTMHPEQFGFLLLWKSFIVQIFIIFLFFFLPTGPLRSLK